MPHHEITPTQTLRVSFGATPCDELTLLPNGQIQLSERTPRNPVTIDCGDFIEQLPDEPDNTQYSDRDFPIRLTDEWRPLARNFVLHDQLGLGTTIATDGVRVIIAINKKLVDVHKSNLVGPVGPLPLDPHDWDWHRNKRRVRIYRRAAPRPPVIVPTNHFLDNLPNKIGRSEFLAYAQLASAAPHIERDDIEKVFQQLLAAASAQHETAVPATSSKKARQQKLLDLI